MKKLLFITMCLICLGTSAQSNKGYFGKKNFFTLGFNPTVDLNIPFFSVENPYISGNEVKSTPLLKPRLGGITLGYSRALGNRFMIGASFRKSQFFVMADDYIWGDKFQNGIYYFEGVKMNRTQASIFIEFASYKWKSLLMGNFMNRLEFGLDIYSIPNNDDFKYITKDKVSIENTFDKEDLETIDLREYKLSSEAKNRGPFLRYSAIQSTPLTQSLILRYGFDVTFYITYMEFFRGNNLGEGNSPEARIGREIAMEYQYSSFRNPVTFRLELVYAL